MGCSPHTLSGLRVAPPSGNGAQLELAFAPFQTPEFAGLKLALQVPGRLEQRRLKRIVAAFSVQGGTMKQQRGLPRMTRGLGVRARTGDLQPHLDTEGRPGFRLVLQHHLGGGDRRQAMQVLELFLHLTVPSGLGVETEIAKSGFHIHSEGGGRAHLASAERNRAGHV